MAPASAHQPPTECTTPLPDAVGYCCPSQVMQQRGAAQLSDIHVAEAAALSRTGGKLRDSGSVTVVQRCLEINDLAERTTHAVEV